MLPNVKRYTSNVIKSTLYATDEVTKKLAPGYAEFRESNDELFKEAYNSVRNYKDTFKKVQDAMMNSKVYEAVDVGLKNAAADLKSGNFYNKGRSDKFETALADGIGGDSGDMGGLSLSDDAFDFDSLLKDDPSESGIDTGDVLVSKTVSSSMKNAAGAIANSQLQSTNAIIKNQRLTTNVLYAQNEKVMGTLQTGFSAVNQTMSSMLDFSNSVLKTHVDNSTTFYKTSTDLQKESNAMLKEMLEMYRNEYKSKQEEENNKEKTKKLRYGDVASVEGAPDIKEYVKLIGSNAKNTLAESGMDFSALFSKDSLLGENPLLAFAQNPLSAIPLLMVSTMMGPQLKNATKSFDKTMSGLFGTILNKFNHMAKSDDMLESAIGKIFGVRDSVKSSMDTSNYKRTAIPWDGEAKKALVEVIPGHLAAIEAALTGRKQRTFDYNAGKYVEVASLDKKFKEIGERHMNSATSDIQEEMLSLLSDKNFLRRSRKDQEDLMKDLKVLMKNLYSDGGIGFGKMKPEDMMYELGFSNELNGKVLQKAFNKVSKGAKMSFGSNRLDARTRHNNEMESMESQFGNVYNNLFNNSYLEKTDKRTGQIVRDGNGVLDTLNLAKTLDKDGNNMFYYLKGMYQELMYIRKYGSGIGESKGEASSKGLRPMTPERMYVNKTHVRDFKQEYYDRQRDLDIRHEQKYTDLADLYERDKDAKAKGPRLIDESGEDKDIETQFGIAITDKAIALAKKKQAKVKESGTFLNEAYGDNKRDFSKKYKDIIDKAEKNGLLDTLLEASSLGEKYAVIRNGLESLMAKPASVLTKVLEQADEKIYKFFYEEEDIIDPKTGKKVTGFFGRMKVELTTTFDKMNTYIDDNILEPLKKKLGVDSFGGAVKKGLNYVGIDVDGIKDSFKDKAKEFLSPVKDSIKETFTDFFKDAREALTESRRQAQLALGIKTEEDISSEKFQSYVRSQGGINPALQKRLDAHKAKRNELEEKRKAAENMSDDDYFDAVYNTYAPSKRKKKKKVIEDDGPKLTSVQKYVHDQVSRTSNGFTDRGFLSKIKGNKKDAITKILASDPDIIFSKYKKDFDDFITKGLEITDEATKKTLMDEIKKEFVKSGFSAGGIDSLGNVKKVIKKFLTRQDKLELKEKPTASDDVRLNLMNAADRLKMHDGSQSISGLKAPIMKMDVGPTRDVSSAIEQSTQMETQVFETAFKSNTDRIVEKLDAVLKAIVGMTGGNVQTHATGARMITKTGITAISKGEMIVPANENPFNPDAGKTSTKDQLKNENVVREGYANALANDILKGIDANYEGNKNWQGVTDKAKDKGTSALKTLGDGINNAKAGVGQFFAQATGLDSKQVQSATQNMGETVKRYMPDAVSKGLLGGVIGTALGGPLVGAMLGSAYGIANNNHNFMDWIFGKKIVDSKGNKSRGGGAISAETQKTIGKYLPDMKAFGITGGLLGLVTPFGPLGGAVIGSAIAVAKNNSDVKKALFGETDGLINADTRKVLADFMPAAAVGALGGALLGPFGLFGNVALGSVTGMAMSTNQFQDVLFGEADDKGIRSGGLAGALKEGFVDPLKDFGKQVKDELFDWIKTDVFAPLKSAMAPIGKQIQLAITGTFKGLGWAIGKMFETTTGRPLAATMRDYVIKPITTMSKNILGGFIKPFKTIASAPFKLIGAFGNRLKSNQVKNGNATYMTAAQREAFRKEHGVADNEYSEFDQAIQNSSSQDLLEMKSMMDLYQNGDKGLKKSKTKAMKGLWSSLDKGIGHTKTIDALKRDKIEKLLHKGNTKKAMEMIYETNGLTIDDKKKVSEEVMAAHNKLSATKKAEKHFGESKDDLAAKMKEYGINLNSGNVDKLSSMLNTEISSKKSKERDLKSGKVDADEMVITQNLDSNTDKLIEELRSMKEAFVNAVKGNSLTESDHADLDSNTKMAEGMFVSHQDKYIQNAARMKNKFSKFYGDDLNISDDSLKKLDADHSKARYKGIVDLAKKNVLFKDLDQLVKLDPATFSRVTELGALGCTVSDFSKVQKLSKQEYASILAAVKMGIKVKNIDEFKNLDPKTLSILKNFEDAGLKESGQLSNKTILRLIQSGEYSQVLDDPGKFNSALKDSSAKTVSENIGNHLQYADTKKVISKAIANALPGFSKGTDEVKKDQLAVVSKGELVTDKKESKKLKKAKALMGKTSDKQTISTPYGEITTRKGSDGTMSVATDKKSKDIQQKVNADHAATTGTYGEVGEIHDLLKKHWSEKKIEKTDDKWKKLMGFLSGIGSLIGGLVPGIAGILAGMFPSLKKVIPGLEKAGAEAAGKAATAAEAGGMEKMATGLGKKEAALAEGGSKKSISEKIASWGETKGGKLGKIAKGTAEGIGILGAIKGVGKGYAAKAGAVVDAKAAQKLGWAYKVPKAGIGFAADNIKGVGGFVKDTIYGARNMGKVIGSATEATESFAANEGSRIMKSNATERLINIKTASGDTFGASKLKVKQVASEVGDGVTKYVGKTIAKLIDLGGSLIGKVPGANASKFAGAMGKFGEAIAKAVVQKGAGQLAAKLASKAIPFIGWGMMAYDAADEFYEGVKNANTVLGITDEPTYGQRLLSGIIKAAANLCTLGIIPGEVVASLGIDYVAPVLGLGKDLREQRDKAQSELDTYNQENGTDLSMEDYLKQQGKYNDKGFMQNMVDGTKAVANDAWEGIKNNAKYVANGIANNVEYVTSGKMAQDASNYVNEKVGAIGDWITSKVDVIKDLKDYCGKLIDRDMQIVWNNPDDDALVELNKGVAIDDSDPLAGYKKTFQGIAGTLVIPLSIAGGVYKNIANNVEYVVNGLSSVGKNMVTIYDTYEPLVEAGDIEGIIAVKNPMDDDTSMSGSISRGLGKIYAMFATVAAVPNAALIGINTHVVKPIFDSVSSAITGMGEINSLFSDAVSVGDYNSILNVSDPYAGDDTLGGHAYSAYFGFSKVASMGLATLIGPYTSISNMIDGVKGRLSDATSTEPDYSFYDNYTGSPFDKEYLDHGPRFDSSNPFSIIPVITDTFHKILNIPGIILGNVMTNIKNSSIVKLIGKGVEWFNNIADKVSDVQNKGKDYSTKPKGEGSGKDKSKFGRGKNRYGRGDDDWIPEYNRVSDDDSLTVKNAKLDWQAKNKPQQNYSQVDPSIANLPFNTSSDTTTQTIGDSACGPMAAATAISRVTGQSVNPIQMATDALPYKETDGGTKFGYFGQEANKYGLDISTAKNSSDVISNLKAGNPTILMGTDSNSSVKTPFGENPHYVTATGLDNKGNIIIQDPEMNTPNSIYKANDVLGKSDIGFSVQDQASQLMQTMSPDAQSKASNMMKSSPDFRKYDQTMNKINNITGGIPTDFDADDKPSSSLSSLFTKKDRAEEVLDRIKAKYAGKGSGRYKYGRGRSKYGRGQDIDMGSLIWQYLRSKGVGTIATAGIMGNMMAESRFDPTSIEGGGHSDEVNPNTDEGYGLCQWSHSRKRDLANFANSVNGSSSDYKVQCDFMLHEIGDNSLLADMDATGSAHAAALMFHKEFERSNDTPQQADRRGVNAEQVFQSDGKGIAEAGTYKGSGNSKAGAKKNGGLLGKLLDPFSSKLSSQMDTLTKGMDSSLSKAFDASPLAAVGKQLLGDDFSNPFASKSSSGSSGGNNASMDGHSDKAVGDNPVQALMNSIPGTEITSPYGPRDLGGSKFHNGVDLVYGEDTPVYSPVSGKVVRADGDDSNGYGNLVVIQDKNDKYHFFGHNDSIGVNVGQQINKGDQISLSGSTGHSTGPHLHYGVADDLKYQQSSYFDPNTYSLAGLGSGKKKFGKGSNKPKKGKGSTKNKFGKGTDFTPIKTGMDNAYKIPDYNIINDNDDSLVSASKAQAQIEMIKQMQSGNQTKFTDAINSIAKSVNDTKAASPVQEVQSPVAQQPAPAAPAADGEMLGKILQVLLQIAKNSDALNTIVQLITPKEDNRSNAPVNRTSNTASNSDMASILGSGVDMSGQNGMAALVNVLASWTS